MRNENVADVNLNFVTLFLKEIEGNTLWNKENRLELELTLNLEVLDGEVVVEDSCRIRPAR